MLTSVKEAGKYLYHLRRTDDRNEYKTDTVRVPELCRRKLLHYAESFQELARSLEPERSSKEELSAPRDAGEERDGLPEDMDRRDALEERRVSENRMLIQYNLNEMAQLMTRLAEELTQCRPMEEHHRKMLRHALRTESIFADQFCYLTDGEDDTHAISMNLYTQKAGGRSAEEVADMLSVLLGRQLKLSAASPCRLETQPHSFVFMEEPKYVALTGFCKVKKEGERISGDHYSILESEKGRLTLLLSDGTGSGESASRDSEKVLDLMEKLLEAGYDTEAAISMVNVAFYAGEEDLSHPTLDLCDLNLYDGKCRFLKVGGALSFLKRGDRVERIRHGSLPFGIFRNPDMEKEDRQLQSGDYVILMTDGLPDAFADENQISLLEQTIAEMADISPGEMAERLLELALRACEGHIRDDMTVLVAGIWENVAV